MINFENKESEKFKSGPLSDEEFNMLTQLRKKQISENLSPEETEILGNLNYRIKTFGRVGENTERKPLSQEEYNRYLELTKKQINARPQDWTEQDANELLSLRKRLENFGRE